MDLTVSTIKELFILESIENDFEKMFVANEVYEILKEAYKNVKGGIHFKSSLELIEKTSKWEILYFDTEIVGVIIYKAKKGLKMVAMALKNTVDKKIRNIAKEFLGNFFKKTYIRTWMEVSEAAEKFILKFGGEKFLVSNRYAKELLQKDIELCDDGYHYYRIIKGVKKRKVIVGSPNC